MTLRFFQQCCAASVLEYAYLLSLIVATGAGAYLLVSLTAEGAFHRAANPWETAAEAKRPAAAALLPEGNAAQTDDWAFVEVAGVAIPRSRAVVAAAWIGLWAVLVTMGTVVWRLRKALRARGKTGGLLDDAGVEATPCDSQERLVDKRQQIRRLFAHSVEQSHDVAAQVQQLMSTDLELAETRDSAAETAKMMKRRRIRHVLVRGKDGRLAGVVSDRDIAQRSGAAVQDIMTRNPVAVSPESPVGAAITQMLSKGISCLPVVDDQGKPCGILTTTDLMLSLQCTLQMLPSLASGFDRDAEADAGPETAAPQRETAAPPLYSTLGGDPDFGEVADVFVQDMPGRIRGLSAGAQRLDWEELTRIAHQIRGSAGNFGFHALAAPAAALEKAAGNRLPEEEILASLDALLSLCSRVTAGPPPTPAAVAGAVASELRN